MAQVGITPIHSENPRFRGNRHSIRNPSSRKGTYGQYMAKNWTTGRLLTFTILHLLLVVVLLQFQLAYLNNQTELRHETLCTEEYIKCGVDEHGNMQYCRLNKTTLPNHRLFNPKRRMNGRAITIPFSSSVPFRNELRMPNEHSIGT